MCVCKIFVLVVFDSARERRVREEGYGAVWLISTLRRRSRVCRSDPVPV